MLRIKAKAKQKMFDHCEQDRSKEACGYLVGQNQVVTDAHAIRNMNADATSYEMDPGEQLALQKQLRKQNYKTEAVAHGVLQKHLKRPKPPLEEMAIYHSHVATEAYPSRRDIDRATAIQDFFDGYYVIVTLKDSVPRARAFKIQDGSVSEEPLVEA